jgi:hypothetical protein
LARPEGGAFALIRTALRRGQLMEAIRLTTINDGRLALSVLASLALGGGD